MDIYVGNINYALAEEDLLRIFSTFGTIIKTVIKRDPNTGESKGYGFITMENSIDAQRAIEELDQRSVAGRNLVVRKSISKEKKGEQPPRHNEKISMEAEGRDLVRISFTR